MNNDLSYLNQRASEERSAALHCRHLGAREIHLELAQAYEFRVFLLKQMDAIKTDPSQFDTAENQTCTEPPQPSATIWITQSILSSAAFTRAIRRTASILARRPSWFDCEVRRKE